MEQLTLDFGMSSYAFNKPVRLIELFAGIGTQAMALEELGINFERYDIVEFDKYCLQSYNAIHGTQFTTTDVRDVKSLKIKETDKYDYVVTYSFPCTDLSLAGKGKGMVRGDSTRSGLLWEVERLLDVSNELPRVLLMENVPQILSVKHKPQFNEWQNFLARKGYTNHVLKLNAKDYGVAQNRDRVFMLSILGNYDYKYPTPIKLEKSLKNYLEDEVDEKYYLTADQILMMFKSKYESMGVDRIKDIDDETINAITTMQGGNREPKIAYPLQSREYRTTGWQDMSPTLHARDYKDPKVVMIPNEPICLNSKVNGKQPSVQDRVYDVQETSTAITTSYMPSIATDLRIRKLTPLEYWRLMGIKDEYYYRAVNAGISNTQLYKQAGNAIVVDVLVAIFRNLFKGA